MSDEQDLPLDRELMSAVDDAFESALAPIPPQLSQFAVDALQWRLVDDELAAISFDSATDELVGIRGTATMRHLLRFEGRGLSIAVNVLDNSFVVSIEPPATYSCRLEGPGGGLDTATDEDGQLALSENHLPLRLIVATPRGRVVSPWITG